MLSALRRWVRDLSPSENTDGNSIQADPHLETASHSAFYRLWRGFMTARVLIALLLLLFQVLQRVLAINQQLLPLLVCAAYFCATVAVRILAKPTPKGAAFDRQWMLSIGIDTVIFGWLQWIQQQPINYAPLLALPVLLASVMGSITLALATAAAVTLYLLGMAWQHAVLSGVDSAAGYMQAGLTGAGYFALAMLANQLSQRLLREQEITRQSQTAARQQSQVNELVIETLVDGVMVVDTHGTVQSLNPSGRLLIEPEKGRTSYFLPFALRAEPGWKPLLDLALRTFDAQMPHLSDLVIQHPQEAARRVRVKTQLTRSDESEAGRLCVLFLQDLPEIEARMRQEKILAMGRMSAAVAHEIRNPLAAISQANALLAEDLEKASDIRLSQMIAQNSNRLARIVDDILNLVRVSGDRAVESLTLPLDEIVQRITEDWCQQNAAFGKVHLALSAPALLVPFDPEHLRRILVNLLDNAHRYSSTDPAAIVVCTQDKSNAGPQLTIWSDGSALEPTVQKHLFEPFFSSESRSSGLGLYICRELCEQHGAVLGYARKFAPTGRMDAAQGNSFFVTFRSDSPLVRSSHGVLAT
jgi:two-component system sensor histidine kinase PilS (NtrC family)